MPFYMELNTPEFQCKHISRKKEKKKSRSQNHHREYKYSCGGFKTRHIRFPLHRSQGEAAGALQLRLARQKEEVAEDKSTYEYKTVFEQVTSSTLYKNTHYSQ